MLMSEPDRSSGRLSKEELELWYALKHLASAALAPVEMALQQDAKMSGSEFAILSRIDDSLNRYLPQSELLASLRWEKSRLSHMLSRMEKAGTVKRASPPAHVSLTEKGSELIRKARVIHTRIVREFVLTSIDANEKKVIVNVVRKLDAIFSRNIQD